MATYTVDLSSLNEDSFSINEENRELILVIPEPVLEPINIPSEDIEFGDVEKNSILALGDIKLTPEEQKEIETEAKRKMIEKLDVENAIEDAKKAAEYAVWDIFHPLVSGVSTEYSLIVAFS